MAQRPFSVADRRRSVADLPDFTQPANGGPSVATRRVEPKAAPPGIEPTLPPYQPITPRRKRLIVALTLATVTGLFALMLEPHRLLMAAKAARAEAAAKAACPPDAASVAPGCPGSLQPVLILRSP
jgi:hypothetical protein